MILRQTCVVSLLHGTGNCQGRNELLRVLGENEVKSLRAGGKNVAAKAPARYCFDS